MQFLCLAFGAEADWIVLSQERQHELLAADAVQRDRGDLVAALGPATVVRNHDDDVQRDDRSVADGFAPLVGFSLIEADSLDEAVALVAGTPCAVAGGAVEIRPLR